MIRMLFSAFFLLLTTVSCSGPRYVDYFPYHDDGCPKPRVVFLPVVCGCQSQLPWDAADALSKGINYQLRNNGELYVLSPKEIGSLWDRRDSIDFFGSDLSFCRELCDADFFVIVELTDDGMTPISDKDHSYHQAVTMRARLRVVDVRRSTPRNIVFENVKADYLLTPPYSDCNYSVCRDYAKTPCGIVQQRMMCTLSTRIEEVIESAR